MKVSCKKINGNLKWDSKMFMHTEQARAGLELWYDIPQPFSTAIWKIRREQEQKYLSYPRPLKFSCVFSQKFQNAKSIKWEKEKYFKRVRHDWATSLSLLTFHFDALEKEMATHSSVLAWRIPGTGEPGGLPSMGSHSRTRLKWLSSSSSSKSSHYAWVHNQCNCKY